MNKEVKLLLKNRDKAFRSRDLELYSTARSNLKTGIKEAKAAYRRKVEGHFNEGDPRRVWQGIQRLTNFKVSKDPSPSTSSNLAEELNLFFARFEVNETRNESTLTTPTTVLPTDALTLCLSVEEVRRAFLGVNPRKAAGPDGIPGRVLRDCADQLAEVFTSIFNISLSTCSIPKCLKSAIIVPIPKTTAVNSLNDYRPVALTSTIMKCFERLLLPHIKASLSPTLDQHQFAYKANRSTADAINTALHCVLTHLEHPGTYARLLFVDFSSAFNCIIPGRLVSKLYGLGISTNICRWIFDFLTDRPQSVRLGSHLSSVLTLSTGAPQGCVLSPLLYILYTHDCTPVHESNIFIKFADDTTIIGLIHNNDEFAYRDEIQKLSTWCFNNNLSLNASKTKEVVVDFRRKRADPVSVNINGDTVERVKDFKILGTYISEDMTWATNITALVKKSQQRLYFLRSLNKINLSQKLLLSFYNCSVQSIITHDILVWFSSCTTADKKALDRIRKSAQNMIQIQLPSLTDIYHTRCLQRAKNIIRDCFHPGHYHFTLLPSGRRYRSFKGRTSRLLNSFYPTAIKYLNSELPLML